MRKINLARSRPVFWAAAGMLILAILVIVGVALNQPQSVDLTDPQAQAIAAVLQKAERLLGEVGCNAAVSVDVLDEVLADWSGYPLTGSAWNMVVRVYGQSAAANGGFLTDRKAYYLSMRGAFTGADATPPNGLRATPRPIIYCPTPSPEMTLSIKSIAIGPYQAIARYDNGPALCEAVLINFEGHWKIGSLKYLRIHF